MSIKFEEHKALLVLLSKIEDEIAKLDDPFDQHLYEYKLYMNLLTKTVNLLNSTIDLDVDQTKNTNYNVLENQFEKIRSIFSN